ncbi:MAG: hypothetical protein ACRD1K_01515 [Acidimicrobiales bacterium]
MKTLPDAPNLDHLRQQAKDVLPQLRVVRPGATLSDAQALIAEYGFRAWSDLVAAVNRRTTTIRRDDDAARIVAETFGLGAPTGPLTSLERQWAGQAWSLSTDRGRWLVRQLFDLAGAANEWEVLLAEAAAAAGIVTHRPVRSSRSQIVETLNGARWRVYERPPLGPEPPTPASSRHATAAGRIIGRVHRLGLPAPMPPARWITAVRSEQQWWTLHAAAEAAEAPWARRLAEVIPTIVDVSGVVEPAEAAGDIILSPCHWAPNAFREARGDELAVVIWEHTGAIPLRWDVGSAVLEWSRGVHGSVNASAACALMSGYVAEASVPPDLDVAAFTAAVCANSNWLATRIQISIKEQDPERRAVAARAVPGLLADLLTRPYLELVLHAVR